MENALRKIGNFITQEHQSRVRSYIKNFLNEHSEDQLSQDRFESLHFQFVLEIENILRKQFQEDPDHRALLHQKRELEQVLVKIQAEDHLLDQLLQISQDALPDSDSFQKLLEEYPLSLLVSILFLYRFISHHEEKAEEEENHKILSLAHRILLKRLY